MPAGQHPGLTVAPRVQTAAHPPYRLRPGLPAALDRVVLRALDRDPGQRYASARARQEDVERVEAAADREPTARWAALAAKADARGIRVASGKWLGARLHGVLPDADPPAPTVPDDGDEGGEGARDAARKQAEQVEKALEKRLEQQEKQQEKKAEERGRR